MKTVDILLPTYNGGKFLQEQITSILNQSYSDFNLLIRDDGSTDHTIQIINSAKELDQRIVFYQDEIGNLGVVANIEYLLGKSKANYIMYCDQDDFWLPFKVEKLVKEILFHEKNFGAEFPLLIHSDSYVTDQDLKINRRFKGTSPLNYGLNNSLFRFYVQGASAIFNSRLKKEILPFLSDVYMHDRYTHLVAEITGKRFYLNEPLMLYRQHSQNLLGSKSIINKIKMNISRKHVFYMEKDKMLIQSLAERYPNEQLLEIYISITNPNYLNKWGKIHLILKHNISLRIKEWFLLIVNL
jgi:rhamnosyltransferase